MKRFLSNKILYISMVALMFIVAACESVMAPSTTEPGTTNENITDKIDKFTGDNSRTVSAAPNLRVEEISYKATLASDGRYYVVFYSTVYNRGTAPSRSFVLGMRGWGPQTISTCTGTWQAINTSSDLAAGAYRTMIIYGPGYVGARVSKGTYLTVTSCADAYCVVGESSESDNRLTKTIRVGY